MKIIHWKSVHIQEQSKCNWNAIFILCFHFSMQKTNKIITPGVFIFTLHLRYNCNNQTVFLETTKILVFTHIFNTNSFRDSMSVLYFQEKFKWTSSAVKIIWNILSSDAMNNKLENYTFYAQYAVNLFYSFHFTLLFVKHVYISG